MRDFIERLKAKPEHVRRRIAIGTTAGITGVVALAWFFTLLFSGTFSLAIPSTIVTGNGTLAQVGGGANTTVGNTSNLAAVNASDVTPPPQSNWARLLGAVGISTAPPPAPALKVEDAATTSGTDSQTSQPTVIPF